MTRNWCNQNQSPNLETNMGINPKLQIDVIQKENIVNHMSTSFLQKEVTQLPKPI